MAKWIEFVEVPAPGATKRWEVIAKQGGTAYRAACARRHAHRDAAAARAFEEESGQG